jgi:hypothetical protein
LLTIPSRLVFLRRRRTAPRRYHSGASDEMAGCIKDKPMRPQGRSALDFD